MADVDCLTAEEARVVEERARRLGWTIIKSAPMRRVSIEEMRRQQARPIDQDGDVD